jgi:hypothetical protein
MELLEELGLGMIMLGMKELTLISLLVKGYNHK